MKLVKGMCVCVFVQTRLAAVQGKGWLQCKLGCSSAREKLVAVQGKSLKGLKLSDPV